MKIDIYTLKKLIHCLKIFENRPVSPSSAQISLIDMKQFLNLIIWFSILKQEAFPYVAKTTSKPDQIWTNWSWSFASKMKQKLYILHTLHNFCESKMISKILSPLWWKKRIMAMSVLSASERSETEYFWNDCCVSIAIAFNHSLNHSIT